MLYIYEKYDTARSRIERSASKRWRGSVRRIAAATIYNLSCFTHGCSTGWVSGVLGTQALTGGAWLAALPCLVALPAAPFFAVLADARGRKAGAFVVSVFFVISWSLAAWCGPRGLWAARAAAGAGGAGALALAPLYCAEIAPRTTGLVAMPALACSCGILFAYGAGGILSPHALSLSMAMPPTVLMLSLLWLPETPSFLINVGRIQDAAKVMCWFEGSDFREDVTDVIEQQEVRIRTSECLGRRELVRRQDSDTFQPMLKRSSGLDSNSEKKTEPSACKDLFRHRRSRRALFSCCVLLCVAAGSGAGAVSSFATAVLQHSAHAVPHLNLTAYNFTIYNGTVPRAVFDISEAGSMLCGTALVLGAAVAMVAVDRVGRKVLLLWSCSGIACCLAILGVYCDPRLRMHSWYSHRLWPYKKPTSFKEKAFMTENLMSNYTVLNITSEELFKNYTKSEDLFKHYTNNEELFKNYTNSEDIFKNYTNNGILLKNYTNNEEIFKKYTNNGELLKNYTNKGELLLNNFTNYDVFLENFTKDDVFAKIDANISKPRYRIDVGNENLAIEDIVWLKYAQNMPDDSEENTIWLPVVLLSMVLFLYNIGLGSVPYVLISELFSVNVRSLASSLLISWMWLTNFLLLRYYGTIAISLGLHSIYYISASVTLLGSLYTYFVLPETRGKSREQIEQDLNAPLLSVKKRRKNEDER